MSGDTTQENAPHETIPADLDAQCIREFGEPCSAFQFVDGTNCLRWFEVGGMRFRLDEVDRVRLHKGDCPRCGIPLWSREFILSSNTARHAANDNPVSHACVIRDASPDLGIEVIEDHLEPPLSEDDHVYAPKFVKDDPVYEPPLYKYDHADKPLCFNDDHVNPIMRYKEVLIVGGVNDRSLWLWAEIVDQGWLPRYLIRKEEEERIPQVYRAKCRVTLGNALIRESVEMAAQGTSAIVFVPGPDSQANARIVRHLGHAASLWRIGLKILPRDMSRLIRSSARDGAQ